MIKLQVNHDNHEKQKSGKKLTKGEQKKGKTIEKEQKQDKTVNQKQKKQDKKQKDKKQQPKINNINKKEQKTIKKVQQQKKQQSIKKDQEKQTIQSIKKQQNKAKMTIQQLISIYKEKSDDYFTNHGHNPQKQQEISIKLQQYKKQKQKRQKSVEEQLQRQRKRIQWNEKKNIEKQQKKINKLKSKIRGRCQDKIKQLEIQANERLEAQAQFQLHLQQYRQKMPRFKKYEEQQTKRQLQLKQQYNNIKKSISNKYKPMNAAELKQFQQKYAQEKWKIYQQHQSKRQFQKMMIAHQNKKFKQLWNGKCHKQTKKQLQALLKQKQLHKSVVEKRKDYSTMVRINHKPQNRQNNSSLNLYHSIETPSLSQKNQRTIIKERYKNGINFGPKIEMRKVALSQQQAHAKGDQYLKFLQSLPKKQKQINITNNQQPKILPKRKQGVFQVERDKNPYYVKQFTSPLKSPNINRISGKISQQQNSLKLQQMKMKHGLYSDIIDYEKKKHSFNNHLVKNISDKIDLLNNM